MQCNLPREIGSEAHDHRLKLYSIAASAAGVSTLALTPPADASVVVTHTNISIFVGSPGSIDLNKDGIDDFRFSATDGGYVPSFVGSLLVAPLTGGKVVGGNRGPGGAYASAMASGANIGATAHFSSSVGRGQLAVERSFYNQSSPATHKYYGQWHSVTNRYLGVRFLIKGAIHYGWVRLTNVTGSSATITEYAYETVANKSIAAGATTSSDDATAVMRPTGPSLGMLALGTEALPAWRQSAQSQIRATIEQ